MSDSTAEAFTKLARVVYARANYESIYQSLVETARDLIPGCGSASIATKRGGEPLVCVAATDEVAVTIDQFENEVGEGPCLDAIVEATYQHDPDIEQHSSWPKLAPLILEHTPVRGMIGYRILVGGHQAAALDIFSNTANALTQESAEMGAVVGSFASVALAAAAHHERAEQLHEALESNREIGRAIGFLMGTQGLTEEEAFNVLRQRSSELNVKLARIARDIVSDRVGGR